MATTYSALELIRIHLVKLLFLFESQNIYEIYSRDDKYQIIILSLKIVPMTCIYKI